MQQQQQHQPQSRIIIVHIATTTILMHLICQQQQPQHFFAHSAPTAPSNYQQLHSSRRSQTTGGGGSGGSHWSPSASRLLDNDNDNTNTNTNTDDNSSTSIGAEDKLATDEKTVSEQNLSHRQSGVMINTSEQNSNQHRIAYDGQGGGVVVNVAGGTLDETSQTNNSGRVVANNNLESNALNYLQKYGYMSAPSAPLIGGSLSTERNNLITEESFSSAIADFQRFAGLPATGLMDNQTLEMMKLPRCGNSDKWQPGAAASPHSGNLLQLSDAYLGEPRSPSRQQLFAGDNLQQQHQQQSRKPSHHNRQFQQQQQQLKEAANRSSATSPSHALGLRRRKRYALQGSKWRRQELTYRISQYPTRFTGKRHEVDAQIAKAFGIWSQVAPIDFVVKREGRVHIDIRFASGDHGDGDAFDGPGNTLAHAYFPQYGGDAHFDDQEYWTMNSYTGTNIFQVAAHELGHSLGLGHSNVREALMAPFYQKYKPNFKLHLDDVLAIQALYGEKPLIINNDQQPAAAATTSPSPTTTSTTTTPTSTTTSTTTTSTTPRPPFVSPFSSGARWPIYKGVRVSPGLGSDPIPIPLPDDGKLFPDLNTNGIGGGGGVSSSGSGSDGDDLGVGGSNSGTENSPSAGYPADLCSDAKIDAITRTEDGSSYMFKGEYYWQLVQNGLAKGYPRRIDADWDGLPGRLDAALTWADGKTFFFKGNKYWRFRNRRRDVGYPKLISAGFAGIPDDIDAAFVWSGNGRTYIFKGMDYWRFDSKSDPPVSSEYPRSIKVWSGLPDGGIDSAFKWDNNVTYFFKGNQYYRFNDREFKVESRGRPPFPRPTSEWWFGCVNSNLAQKALPNDAAAAAANGNFNLAPSGFRESRMANGEHHSVGQSSAPNSRHLATPQQQPTVGGDLDDWSFLAKSDDTNQLRSSMGTHVNDRQPPPPQASRPANSNPRPIARSNHDHHTTPPLDHDDEDPIQKAGDTSEQEQSFNQHSFSDSDEPTIISRRSSSSPSSSSSSAILYHNQSGHQFSLLVSLLISSVPSIMTIIINTTVHRAARLHC